MTTTIDQERLLNCQQVARQLGVSRETIRQWRDAEGMPSVVLSKQHRYRLKDVIGWLDQRQRRGNNQYVAK